MILGGVFERMKILQPQDDKTEIRRIIAKWRVNTNSKWAKSAIDHLLISGPIKMESFFYKIKSFASKNADIKSYGSGHQRKRLNNH